MATAFVGNAAQTGVSAITTTSAGQITANYGVYELATALIINDTIAMCKLPANHKLVTAYLDSDDLDTDGTPTIVMDVGIIDGDVDSIIDGTTIGQTGGRIEMNVATQALAAAATSETIMGIKVITAPETGTATGTLALTLLSRPIGQYD